MKFIQTILIVAFAFGGFGCAQAPIERREAVNAALWMQKTIEYRIATQNVYRLASEHLVSALGPGTAAAEQEGAEGAGLLPPAVILDVDETVLDNSRYQAWRIKSGNDYTTESFRRWVLLAEAGPVEGAVEFVAAAKVRGLRVVYVTNRDCLQFRPAVCPEKQATIKNLNAVGFAPMEEGDVLFRGERPDWYDKEARRTEVARTHRIVMLIGDDLRDLLPTEIVGELRTVGGERRNKAHLDKVGTRLFLLPNPVYGSWEYSVATESCNDSDGECKARNLKRKYDALDPVVLPPLRETVR